MGLAPGELAAQRAATKWYVDADAFDCVLIRATEVSNGAGGYIMQDVPLNQQRLRMNPLQDATTERVTPDGRKLRPAYMLIGYHDADVERLDRFFKDGREYEIVFLVENQQYQVKAEVAYVG